MRTIAQRKKDKQYVGRRNVLARQESFDLQKMKDGFLLEQKCRGNSGETIKYYDWNISRFIRYLEESQMETDTSAITKDEIKRYIVYLKGTKKWEKTEFFTSDEQLASKSIQT